MQIPHKWEGTVDELLAGAAEVEAFVTIKATFDILNENPLAYAQKDKLDANGEAEKDEDGQYPIFKLTMDWMKRKGLI